MTNVDLARKRLSATASWSDAVFCQKYMQTKDAGLLQEESTELSW